MFLSSAQRIAHSSQTATTQDVGRAAG